MAFFTLVLSVQADAVSQPVAHISANYHKKELINKKTGHKQQSRRTHQSSSHGKNSNRGHRSHSKNSGHIKLISSLAPASYSFAWNITGQENQYRTHPYSEYKGEISSPPPRFA